MRNYVYEKDQSMAIKLYSNCILYLEKAEKAYELDHLEFAEFWMSKFKYAKETLENLHNQKLIRDRSSLYHKKRRALMVVSTGGLSRR